MKKIFILLLMIGLFGPNLLHGNQRKWLSFTSEWLDRLVAISGSLEISVDCESSGGLDSSGDLDSSGEFVDRSSGSGFWEELFIYGLQTVSGAVILLDQGRVNTSEADRNFSAKLQNMQNLVYDEMSFRMSELENKLLNLLNSDLSFPHLAWFILEAEGVIKIHKEAGLASVISLEEGHLYIKRQPNKFMIQIKAKRIIKWIDRLKLESVKNQLKGDFQSWLLAERGLIDGSIEKWKEAIRTHLPLLHSLGMDFENNCETFSQGFHQGNLLGLYRNMIQLIEAINISYVLRDRFSLQDRSDEEVSELIYRLSIVIRSFESNILNFLDSIWPDWNLLAWVILENLGHVQIFLNSGFVRDMNGKFYFLGSNQIFFKKYKFTLKVWIDRVQSKSIGGKLDVDHFYLSGDIISSQGLQGKGCIRLEQED